MSKKWSIGLFIAGVILVIIAIWICWYKKTLEVLAATLALEFFLYKIFTGWLIINLNVRAEAERLSAGNKKDHLGIKIILSKGGTDSLWIKDIQVKLSSLDPTGGNLQIKPIQFINPVGAKKLKMPADNYWDYDSHHEYYTLSSSEEVTFSGYTLVDEKAVISAEILVLGTRLFYNFGNSDKFIQWRSSIIILPEKK